MVRDCLACAIVVACTSAPFSDAGAEPRAVVELFTSQGCSSCPPADKLLSQFVSDPSLIPISLPIDYWDYLGWKDTLADPRNSARQRAYSHVRGDREVYTPQVVVNGSVHALGSDKDAIEAAITLSHKNGMTLALPVTVKVATGMSWSACRPAERVTRLRKFGFAVWSRPPRSPSVAARTVGRRSPTPTWRVIG
jgi:hypothetical protein